MNMYDKIRKKLQEARENREKSWTNFKWLGDKETVRILPKARGQRDVYFEGGRHFNIGDKNATRLCPSSVYASMDEEQACPLCEASSELLKSPHAEDKTTGKDMRVTPRFFFNAVIRGEEEKGVQFLEAPKTVWEQIVNCYFVLDEDEEVDMESGPYVQLDDGSTIFNFTDPLKGRDFVITKNKVGRRTTYDVQMKPANRKLGTTSQMKEWLASMESLDEVVPNACPSYDELRKLIYGDEEVEEPEEELEVESDTNEEEVEEQELEEEAEEVETDLDELGEDDLEFDEETGEIVPKKTAKKTTKKSTSNLDKKMRTRLQRGGKK